MPKKFAKKQNKRPNQGLQNEKKEKPNSVLATVTEALPDTLFRVEYENGETGLAFLAGKMKLHRIRVMVGDKVRIEVDPYGGKGRLVQRM